MKTRILLLISFCCAFSVLVEASSQVITKGLEDAPKIVDKRLEYEKIIQEYKDYLATIPVETRQEIVAYRREVSRLNLEKMNLFEKLSQRAQEYLKKERDFKQRLPIDPNQANPANNVATAPDASKEQDKTPSKK
jgi:hypothetical protein